MDRRLHLFVILVITVALLVVCVAGQEERSGRKKQRNKDKKKGDKNGGGGESRVDRAVKQVLKNMAKVSKPLRLPPAPHNDDDKNDNHRSRGVALSVDFGLTAVSDVNVNGGYIDLHGMLTSVWQDTRLKYDLSKISKHIRTLRVDPSTIWTPDLEVYNPVAPGLQMMNDPNLAVVSPDGDVFYSTQVRLRSTCDILGQLSQSDTVNCTVKIGSWAYNGLEIQLNMNKANRDRLHDFQQAGLWTVTKGTAWIAEEKYACCPEIYLDARFSYLLRKRDLPSH